MALVWSGNATVACDDVVAGAFPLDFRPTLRCELEVWWLEDDSVVVTSITTDTGAEHSTKLSATEWELLGYQPLETMAPREQLGACENIVASLRITAAGLRVEAARQILFRGNVRLGSGDKVLCCVWVAAPPAALGGSGSGAAALLVKAQFLQGTFVLRVPTTALRERIQPPHVLESIGAATAEVAEAICATLFANLYLDQSKGALRLKTPPGPVELTSVDASPHPAAVTPCITPPALDFTELAVPAAPTNVAGTFKGRHSFSRPKNLRVAPFSATQIPHSARLHPLHLGGVFEEVEPLRHRAKSKSYHATGRRRRAPVFDPGLVKDVANNKPGWKHSSASAPVPQDPLAVPLPRGTAASHAQMAPMAIPTGSFKQTYRRRELRGLATWNKAAATSILKRELHRTDMLAGGFIKSLSPTVSVSHASPLSQTQFRSTRNQVAQNAQLVNYIDEVNVPCASPSTGKGAGALTASRAAKVMQVGTQRTASPHPRDNAFHFSRSQATQAHSLARDQSLSQLVADHLGRAIDEVLVGMGSPPASLAEPRPRPKGGVLRPHSAPPAGSASTTEGMRHHREGGEFIEAAAEEDACRGSRSSSGRGSRARIIKDRRLSKRERAHQAMHMGLTPGLRGKGGGFGAAAERGRCVENAEATRPSSPGPPLPSPRS